jgi:hypothetical protein
MGLMVELVEGADALVHALRGLGVDRNVPVAVALVLDAPRAIAGFATATGSPAISGTAISGTAISGTAISGTVDDVVAAVATAERVLRPRWVWWQREPAALLVPHGIRLGACWDLAAVHRVIHGGWRVDEVRIWCAARGLDRRNAPVSGQLDLGSGDAGDGPHPAVRADGHLRAEWVEGAWRDRAAAAAQWAELALQVQQWQVDRLAGLPAAGDAMSLARSESAAESSVRSSSTTGCRSISPWPTS